MAVNLHGQTKDQVEEQKKRKFVFKHTGTGEVYGFEDRNRAMTVVGSPSWEAVNKEAKALKPKE